MAWLETENFDDTLCQKYSKNGRQQLWVEADVEEEIVDSNKKF